MRLSWLMKGIYGLCAGLWLFVVLGVTARPAYAYVDPGSGLLLAQMVGSTFAGAMFLLRKRIRQLFGRLSGRQTEAKNDAVEH
jgi:hypothetical protein